MAQCLNLKHPNLLALFDIRSDSQGDHWVVMEYIAGEPLSAVLNRHSEGLAGDLAQQWFLALARAVGYLHEQGIVHRDLKPANIFLENGIVKIGDYGLCKFISSSQRSAQTQSVGTVHYMAPEISTGNYNKQIDVYAAGIILYEMLTGRVPFEGESAGEILMKHLTTPPDLTKLPAKYVPIVGRALAKNPVQRYVNMAEMALAVESVGQPAPRKHASGVSESVERVVQAVQPPTPAAAIPEPVPVTSLRGQIGELCGSLTLSTLLAALFCGALWTQLSQVRDWSEVGAAFFLTVASCWAVLIPAKFWSGRSGDSGFRRTVMMGFGLLIGALALWLEGWSFDRVPTSLSGVAEESPGFSLYKRDGILLAAGYLSFFGLGFFALRWWKMADRLRAHRFSLVPILAAGFWAVVLTLVVWPHRESPQGAIALILASVIVQWVSPWEPPPLPAVKRMRLRHA
jgi:hypothetical protein